MRPGRSDGSGRAPPSAAGSAESVLAEDWLADPPSLPRQHSLRLGLCLLHGWLDPCLAGSEFGVGFYACTPVRHHLGHCSHLVNDPQVFSHHFLSLHSFRKMKTARFFFRHRLARDSRKASSFLARNVKELAASFTNQTPTAPRLQFAWCCEPSQLFPRCRLILHRTLEGGSYIMYLLSAQARNHYVRGSLLTS